MRDDCRLAFGLASMIDGFGVHMRVAIQIPLLFCLGCIVSSSSLV